MTCTSDDVKQLFAEFPKEAVHWRAQTLTSAGDKALALAYIDARDVMDRLDSVCGAENWQDRYEFHGKRTVCYLSIRIDGEWVTKADGAGDSDVEAEKGAISDALKRAAVKWGIGRYLYDLDAVWVPCECTEYQGKKKWKRFTANPWDHVKGQKPEQKKSVSAAQMKEGLKAIDADLLDCHSSIEIDKCAKIWGAITKRDGWSEDYLAEVKPKFDQRRAAVAAAENEKEAA